ncbi:hypothetical protein GALMADRAFT_156116 [Galerina marginata CBS 339.88]|uniref:Uncharacterized protein n=1 Tax=Galerina marginata (strain CBS 339.88) TaxID=685588 RepID=A0A067T2S7_GALM3|nr:hypothetical protein GALMADRAFT_156116 [Galerina marginata CBS 339.88]
MSYHSFAALEPDYPSSTFPPTPIPPAELAALTSAYDGKRCILTQRESGIDWAQLIPLDIDEPWQARRISTAKSLNLVSSEFDAVCRGNILPLNKADHASFSALTWTIYPTLPTLLRLIEHEESQLLRRHLLVAANRPDAGRPPYAEFYGTLDSESGLPYDVHFGADFTDNVVARNRDRRFYRVRSEDGVATDQFPTLSLVCNVNVVVMTRTSALARPMLTPSRSSQALVLGAYLITLWSADPRQIALHLRFRPVFLPPLNFPPTDSGCPVLNPSTADSHSFLDSL